MSGVRIEFVCCAEGFGLFVSVAWVMFLVFLVQCGAEADHF